MYFENSHQNKMSSFKFFHRDKDKGRSFIMIEIVNLIFFSGLILFDNQ